jgi:hypothetical protein
MTFTFAVAAALTFSQAEPTATPTVLVVPALNSSGEPTELWRKAVAKLRSKPVAMAAKPLSPGEAAWLSLITDRSRAWPAETAELIGNFPAVEAPREVQVIAGNQGAEDAFVHDPYTIAFDVGRLASIYGDPANPANADRIDRFFRHEYTHLLQKRWLALHPFDAKRPIDRAMLDMWSEGLGNYYSLSDKWRSPDGSLTPVARAALARLSPLMVARLAALSCISEPGDEANLTADLSMGSFEDKWGALPVALWLAEESATSPDALREFVRGGPAAVWSLLERRLDAPLARVLDAVRAQDVRCTATP